MPAYKLHYFSSRGMGETIRQIFAVAKQDYEDVRYQLADFQQHKDKFPFGQLPVLEEDGKQLGQSGTIQRYLARKFGLFGKTAWEEAEVDALADQWKDFTAEILPYFRIYAGHDKGDEEKARQEIFLPAVKKHYAFFVAAFKKTGSGYLVGNSLTYVDLMVAEFIDMYIEKKFPEVLKEFPELVEHRNTVHSNPELKKWRETRPVTQF